MTFAPIDYYDGIWNKDLTRPLLDREAKAIKAIADHVRGKSDFALLDVGCGDGSFLKELDTRLDVKGELHGIDYSHNRIERAAALPYLFRQCNIEDGMPYEPAKFDVVYAGEVIEHLYNPDFLLEECHRVLKRNGLLVLSTPNLNAWYNRVIFALGIQPIFYEVSTRSALIGYGPLARIKRQDTPVGHLRLFNRRAISDILHSQNFEIAGVSGATFNALPRSLQWVDGAFSRAPSWASILVVAATRRLKH